MTALFPCCPPRLSFTPTFTLLPGSAQEMGRWGQYRAVLLCISFLLRFSLCSAVGSPWATDIQEYPSAPAWAYHGQQCGYLLHHRATPPALSIVVTLLFLTLLVPSSLALSYMCFPRDPIHVADVLSCVPWWIHCEDGQNQLCPARFWHLTPDVDVFRRVIHITIVISENTDIEFPRARFLNLTF